MTIDQIITVVSALTALLLLVLLLLTGLEWLRIRRLQQQYLDIQKEIRERDKIIKDLEEKAERLVRFMEMCKEGYTDE